MRRLRTLDPTLVPRVLLLTGIVLCVVVFDVRAVKPFDVVKLAALWVFTWSAFGIWLFEVVRGRLRVQGFRLVWLAAALVAACGIATLFSITRVVSFFGGYGRYNGFVEFVMYAVLFFLVVQLYWRRPERLKEVLYALGTGAVIASVYLLLQWRGFDPINWRTAAGREGFRFYGTLGNSNFAGGYLGATFPWLFVAFRDARRWSMKVPVVGLAIVTVSCVVLTASRGGVLALVATVLVGVLAVRRLLSARVLIAGIVVAVVGLAGLGVAASLTPPRKVPLSSSESSPLRVGSLRTRAWWWGAALKNFAQHPVVGTGPDTFEIVWPQLAPLDSAGFFDAEGADQPHNVPLGYASGMGILGIGSYVLLVGCAFGWGVRRLRVADRPQGDLLAAFLAVESGYLAQSIVSIDVTPLAATGWLALGALATLCDPRILRARGGVGTLAPRPSRTGLRWIAVAVVAGATAFLVALGVRAWTADRVMKVKLAVPPAELRARLERGIRLSPYEPLYRGLAGDALQKSAAANADPEARKAMLVEAVTRLKELDELQPGHHLWKMTIGEALGRLGEAGEASAFAEADIWFTESLDLSHADWRVPARYGEMLNRWGKATGDTAKVCQALDELNRAFSLRDNDPSVLFGRGISYVYLGQLREGERELRRASRMLRAFSRPPPEFEAAAKRAEITLRNVEKLRSDPPKRRSCR